jgi:hypothetical protein
MAGSMQGATTQKRKSLNRETQSKIGKQLEITYNEVVDQGIPDRFVELIRRLEEGGVQSPAESLVGDGMEGVKDASGEKGS